MLNRENKKILMIAATPFFSHRGCHIRIYEEISFLQKRGHSVKLVTYHFGENIEGIDTERIPNFFWYKNTASYLSLHKIYFDIFVLFKAFIAAIRHKPDILHCHSHEGAFIGILVNVFFRKKLILDSQGSLSDDFVVFGVFKRNSFFYKLCILFEKFIYRYSDAVLVSNKSNYDVLVKDFKISPKKIFVVADGVNAESLDINKELVKNLRAKYNLQKYRHVIVYCGTMNESEGIEILLETMKRLKTKRNDFILLLMGYPNVEHYKDVAKKMGLEDCVNVLGRINYFELFSHLYLGTCAVSFKMLTTEGNLKLLHYGILGLPAFCFDHSSNRYIMGGHAFYLKYQEAPEYYAEKIDEVLNSPGRIRLKGEEAKKWVCSTHSNSLLLKELLEAYRENNGKD
ncbi:glycosyltransferase [Patescibacteria group bacterium]|nr:glycosyltransferase [Patescibacteria group bacterium]